jgi:uncharacterized membrane protein YedE/YeeE
VLGFLDVAGHWDPSLGLVMAGAIGAHVGAALWARRARRPVWANSFIVPRSGKIDASLVAGASLFGLGWGAVGYCPGPALVDLAAPSASLLTFVLAMLAGAFAFRLRHQLARELSERMSPEESTADHT